MATRQIVVTSGSFTTAAAGTYHWVATYNGDTNNAAVSSACADEPVVIGVASSAVITTAPSPGVVSRRLHQRHGDGDRWLQPHRHGHLQPVPAEGHDLHRDPGLHLHQPAEREPAQRHLRAPFATTTAGVYHWVATYNGDTNNAAVSSDCAAEPVAITQATPTIATTALGGRGGRHLHLGHGDGERRLQPHRHGHLQPVPADGRDLHRDPGLHLHQRAQRGHRQRHLGPLRDHRRGHLPLGRHLQR